MSSRTRSTLLAALAVLLSCLSLHVVLMGSSWFPHLVVAVAVAAGCGALGRRLPGPAVLLPLLTPLGLVLVLGVEGGSGSTLLRIVPTPGTARAVARTVRAGVDDLHTYASPAPATRGIVLLAVAGVYVVAALVDLLAVTARRPALAGVPLLAMLLVPASVHSSGAGAVPVGLAIIGWLILLAHDGRERVAAWGSPLGSGTGRRHATANPAAGPRIRASVTASVTAVGLASVALVPGLLAPHVAPPLRANVLAGGSATTASPEKLRTAAPLVTVRTRLHAPEEPLLQVTTNFPQYLRQTSLDDFDGKEFRGRTDTSSAPVPTTGPLAGILPKDPAPRIRGLASKTVRATISTLDTFDDPLLPAPLDPEQVPTPPSDLVFDPTLRALSSTADSTEALSYSVVSHVLSPTPAQLRGLGQIHITPGSPVARDIALPAGLPESVAAKARQITAGATTEYDEALRLQDFFAKAEIGDFTYDLTASVGDGYAGLVQFLNERRGYCEQFATAFAIMARSLNIPTRVAVGFTWGQQIGTTNTWSVSTGDSHSWPEVWFDGYGWLSFEPTPREDVAAFAPGYTGLRLKAAAPSATPTGRVSTPARNDTPSRRASRAPVPIATATTSRHGSDGLWAPVLAGILLSVLAMLTAPAVVRADRRRRRIRRARRGEPAAPLVWAELLDTLDDHGVRPPPRDTPRLTAVRVGASLPDGDGGARAAMQRLAAGQEQARYQAPGSTAVLDRVSADAGWRDVRQVRAGLQATGRWGQQLRVLLAPRSVVRRLRRKS